jgi:hypothetical protein
MDETARPFVQDRLRLAESLLRAVEDSMPPLQRLLGEVHKEVVLALQGEIESAREEELRALRREVDQLREGMASRAVIERAKGILMQGQGLSETAAFDLLNDLSQRYRRKLRDIAADVASGTLPPHLAVVRGEPSASPTTRSTQRRGRPAETSLTGQVADG